jgi:hypothetical protein
MGSPKVLPRYELHALDTIFAMRDVGEISKRHVYLITVEPETQHILIEKNIYNSNISCLADARVINSMHAMQIG